MGTVFGEFRRRYN